MADPSKTPPVLSPQQIVRARYKQQMMPPRTWKQQQARQEQVAALNRSRQASARSAFTAAAAKASKLAQPAVSAPPKPVETPEKRMGEQPTSPLASAGRRSSSVSSTASQASHTSQDLHRPPLVRQGSSTSSISRSAVLAAQNSVGRSPRDRHRANSASSQISSLASSRRGSVDDSPLDTMPLRPLGPMPAPLPASGLPSKRQLQHGLPPPRPLSRPTNAPPANTQTNVSAQKVTNSPQRNVISPVKVVHKGTQKGAQKGGSPASRPASRPTSRPAFRPSLRPARPGSQPSQSASQPVQSGSQVGSARAAAFASVRAPIAIAPEPSMSSKFVSSLTQALKRQQRLSAEEERALEAIAGPSAGRGSQDSVRSVGSTASGKSWSGKSASSQTYAISPDSFLELKLQQKQQQQQQQERRLRAVEENKANALQAAVAAGARVETDMASIHMQVNEAVKTALQHQSRRSALLKYRPAASWSSPRIFRPQLRRLQTDSLAEPGPSSSQTSLMPFPSPLPSTPAPASAPVLTPVSSASAPVPTPALITTDQPDALPEKWIGEPPPNVNMVTIPPKQTTKHVPRFASTLRTQQQPRRNREIVIRDPLPPQPLVFSPHSPAAFRRSSMEMNSGFDFRAPTNPPRVSQEPPPLQPPPLQQRMPKTLRDFGSSRFNQDKPWKGHREASELSERERKRYESLWAANKDVHLPFMCVPPKYQKPWLEAIAQTLPDLLRSGTPQAAPSSQPSTGSSSPASLPKEKSINFRVHDLSPSSSTVSTKSSSSVDKFDSASQADLDQESDVEVEVEPESLDMVKELAKWRNDVHGYVVARLWRRSRLPEETLAQVWDLVDSNKDGTLDRSAFVVGMWLCDQCLYGRKLPSKVPQEVWQSVGSLNLKVRFKKKRSKIGYVRILPNMFGSVVGLTMHSGRQMVKKTVQTATR